jgi:rubredoxin
VRKKPLLRIFGIGLFPVYDILCAHDFNPNERTGFVFSCNNPKFLLAEQLRRSVVAFYNYRASITKQPEKSVQAKKQVQAKPKEEFVQQCSHCLTIYDPAVGQPESGIIAGTLFTDLPKYYCCPLCEATKAAFNTIPKSSLGLHSI